MLFVRRGQKKINTMGLKSEIQWTDATWNIARGCTKVDEDCKFCYMYRDSFDGTRYNPRQVVQTKTVFNLPLKLKEPSKIFTCSLTDFFSRGMRFIQRGSMGDNQKMSATSISNINKAT